MTFEQFQATGRAVADIGAVLADCGLEGRPGRIYVDALYIEDAADWKPHPRWSGRWYTIVGRAEYRSDDLAEIERVLYTYACAEGFTG